MTSPTADELLSDLDPLPYPRRMRELAARAREAAERGDLGRLLDDLGERGPYERRLAVVAAAVGRHTGHLEARLTDPDPVVRGHALRAAAVRDRGRGATRTAVPETSVVPGPGAAPEPAPVLEPAAVAEPFPAAGGEGAGGGVPAGGAVRVRGRISDDALEAALGDAPAAVRVELLRTIVAGRRTALADRLVEPHRERWGDGEAARLLPGCGAPTVARLLPELFHAVRGWRGLAARHPAAVLDEAERQLAALPEAVRVQWWHRYAPAVALCAAAHPRRTLDLLERYGGGRLPAPLRRCLPALTAADPGRTLRLLLAPERAAELRGHGLSRSLLRRLVRQDPPELAALGLAWSERPDRLADLLRALPPARREDFYDAATAGQDTSRTLHPDTLLDVLPHRRRQTEARRMADVARERQLGWETELSAVAHLPVDEARDRLLDATRRASAEDRAEAWTLLVRNAARAGDPARVSELLDEMERLRDERDPVRSAALAALARVHPRLFNDGAVPVLDRIAAEAIRARDSSAATRGALGGLAVALLREHAATGERDLVGWTLRTVTRLSGHTGGADLGRLDRSLRRGQERQVFEALRPWLEAGAEKVDHGLTFALARALGRRAAGLPELQELLWQAVQFGDDATARTGIGLWLADPATRDERVEKVLALDSSTAVLDPVLRVLTRRRTDLLDRLLDDSPPHGRFRFRDSGSWLPPVGRYVNRWLPRQQAAAARLLTRAAGDASLVTRRRTTALTRTAFIPGLGAREIRRWTDSPNVELAEAALGALVRTDRPGDALPVLLDHVGDDRARVAMYAATRASRYVEPSRLEGVLRGVLLPGPADGESPVGGARGASAAGVSDAGPPAPGLPVAGTPPEGAPASGALVREAFAFSPAAAPARAVKVTSRKEAVRLAAARLPVPAAAALLAETYAADPHRDVRVACVASASGLLADERAWELTESAATEEPEERRAVLRTRPLDLPEPRRARYARLVTGLCETGDRETAAAAYAALATWAPWAPHAAGALTAAVTDLDNRGTWRDAADGLVALVTSLPAERGAFDALSEVLSALVAADAAGGVPDAEAERDRPARRRVEHLTERLATLAVMRPATGRPAARRAGELLCGHPDFLPAGVRLLTQAVDLGTDAESLGAELARLALLHKGRPVLAQRTASALGARLRTARRPGSGDVLHPVARRLAEYGTAATGLLAVELTAAGGERSGWSEPWRGLLVRLRRHPGLDVRDGALALETARE